MGRKCFVAMQPSCSILSMFPQGGYEKREPFAVRSERFLQIEIDNSQEPNRKGATLPEGDTPPFVRHCTISTAMERFLVCLVLNLQSAWPMQKQEMMLCCHYVVHQEFQPILTLSSSSNADDPVRIGVVNFSGKPPRFMHE